MNVTSEKRPETATDKPPQSPALEAHQFISTVIFSQLAGIDVRTTRKIISRSLAGRPWRGARLTVREARGPGGAGGKRYEILLSSLPVELQAKWHRQQPGAEQRETFAAHLQSIEPETNEEASGPTDWRDVRPIAEQMRQALWAHYDRLNAGLKSRADKDLEIRTFDDSLSGADTTERQRAEIVIQKFGISVSKLYSLRRRTADADRSEWLPLLAPRYVSDPERTKAELSEEAWEQGKAWYLTLQRRSAISVYRDLQRFARERELIIPAYATFNRMLGALPRWLRVLKREGEKRFSQMYPAHARFYGNLEVNEVWVADGRITDTLLRGEDGRPYRGVIVTMLDARTRVAVGYAIGKTESADLYRDALLDAIKKTGGIVPRYLYVDNSRAVSSRMLSAGSASRNRFTPRPEDPLGILALLGIQIIRALPGWAQSKNVESFHRTLSEMDRKTGKAYLGNRPDARPEDHDPRAAIPRAQYCKLIDETLGHYHQRPHRGDSMQNKSPRAMYDELIVNTQVRRATEEQIALCSMGVERVKLRKKDNAVMVWDNSYWASPLADLQEGSFVVVRYHPDDLSKPVRIYDDDGKFLCLAPQHDRTGFRDQRAGKANQRAKRQWMRAKKGESRALVDMRKSASWLPAVGDSGDPTPSPAQPAAAKLPSSNILEMLPPQRRRPAENRAPAGSRGDVGAALARFYSRKQT